MDRKRLKARLEALRAELKEQEMLAEEERAPVELDQTIVGRLSRIGALQVQEMALASERRRRAELARVEAALARIGTDEFGYCATCGEPIAEARLEHNPAVTTCIGCAD